MSKQIDRHAKKCRNSSNSSTNRMLSYLQLNQGETTTSTNFAVILDGRASDDRPQLVDGTGSDGSSLGLSDGTTVDLLRRLFLCMSVDCQEQEHNEDEEG